MKSINKHGLYVSYYLARFNKEAYKNLGFGNQSSTHKRIGEILNVNPYTIKNWRDEFDVFFPFRSGWHQREPRTAIINIKNALENYSEPHIFSIVSNILKGDFSDETFDKKLFSKHLKNPLVEDRPEGIDSSDIKHRNELAIIVAFYLSKFDKEALEHLGYVNDSEAFEKISLILGVKKNYIKFRRDEFDPVHPWRKGWSRPMDKRIKKAIDALQDLPEHVLRGIVLGILNYSNYRKSEEITEIIKLFSEVGQGKSKKGIFVLRAPTGKKAEELFIDYHKRKLVPINGILTDCRDLGCGYDFKISSETNEFFFEVKGLSDNSGGILFTDKEWETAKEKQDMYFLVVVKNISDNPEVSVFRNPASRLSPKMNLYTSVQVSWCVSQKSLDLLHG